MNMPKFPLYDYAWARFVASEYNSGFWLWIHRLGDWAEAPCVNGWWRETWLLLTDRDK